MTTKPSAPVLPVEAWLYQHEETGMVGFVDQQQVNWGFQAANPRLQLIAPLCKVSDALAAVEADRASRADALPLTDEQLNDVMESVNFTYNPTLFARAVEAAHGIAAITAKDTAT